MGDNQGFVKGEEFCFRYLDFYFLHGESTSTASQKSKDLNKVLLLLKDLGQMAIFKFWSKHSAISYP